jgi:hypothetical protein
MAVLTVIAMIHFAQVVRAANVGQREVNLSRPVGDSILPGGGIADTTIETSFIFRKLIPFAIKYGIRLAVGLAVLTLIFGGFQMMTAYGDSEKRQSAQKTILWAIIGLIIAITAFGIVTVISNISFV